MKAKKTKKPVVRKAVKKPAEGRFARKLPASEAKPAHLRLGELWKGQGGVYVGNIRGEVGKPDAYLVMAVAPAANLKGAYGSTERLKAAEGTRDGMANTLAMVKAGSDLAKRVRALRIDGHADFYIGARDEARIAYANAREHMPKEWLWTSTQVELIDGWAWMQHFGDGRQFDDLKSHEYRAFVLRRVPIQ